MYRADGSLSALGEKWIEFLRERKLPEHSMEPVKYVKGFDEPNPGSHEQIKNWLFSLGWKPQTFKYQRNKETGDIREIPQISLPNGGGTCPSVLDLSDDHPDVHLLDGLSTLSHRISILGGFLRDERDGRLAAKVAGLTNTLRFKHAEIVNLPKVDRLYAKAIRSSLIADEGYELCGSDMSSLEDRIKQHFIYKFDPEYVNELNRPDYDPHLDLAILGGGLTKTEAEAYKAGDKSKKKVRDIFKNGNYACQYGAGPPRLSLTCNVDIETARRIHKAYWERNWAIKAVAAAQKTKKTKDGQMWLLNPISNFWYSLRQEKDIFSTLVQGTAAFVFDLWVRGIRQRRPQITAQFHDEVVLQIKKGFREECKELIKEAIDEANDLLGLNRELSVDIQFGECYADIH